MTIDDFVSKFPGAKRSGNGWSAPCPGHDDQHNSLSLGVGDDGRLLMHCFAGCDPASILAMLGLTLADLCAATASRTDGSTHLARRKFTAFCTADDAIACCERQLGRTSARWPYHLADGTLAGYTLRWDLPGGKQIRPVSLHGNEWRVGAMPEPRPLYGLPGLRHAKRTFVCEGEKAADAARSIGLVATTSSGGAKAAAKTDWAPLLGKEVVILPDNDPPGRQYAQDVTAILSKLSPVPVIKVIDLACA